MIRVTLGVIDGQIYNKEYPQATGWTTHNGGLTVMDGKEQVAHFAVDRWEHVEKAEALLSEEGEG